MAEIIVLQFVHDPPVTTASLSPVPDEQGVYREPVTVTLSATAIEGFTVSATYYVVDESPTQTYNEPFVISEDGTHTIEYWSVDNVGVFEIPATLTIEILTNQPPVADAGGPNSVPEGGLVVLSGSGSDPDGDPLTYTWDLDNDGSFETLGQTATFSAAGLDGPDSRTVILQVCDDKGACATSSATVSITNVAPTIALSGATSVHEGSHHTLTLGVVTDPGDDTVTQYIIHWGDGGTDTYTSAGDVTHTYADGDASQTITVDLVDKDGTHTEASSLSLTVNNVVPTVGEITAPLDPLQVNTEIATSASFTDPGVLDTHTAVWDWGDGSTSPGTVSETDGSDSVTGSHIYATAGVYTVTLKVTDKDGSTGQSVFQFIVVYDPDAGFVTGGGWINSPEGAYTDDPSLAGKAKFGFVSKYKKGATTPTDETEFQFNVADLNFHSDNYAWLVIAGARAQYKGTGTINDEGEYGFMLVAIDDQVNGGGGVDKFRIKIWDKATDQVIYDNKLGEADDSNAVTELGGGSIVIHSK